VAGKADAHNHLRRRRYALRGLFGDWNQSGLDSDDRTNLIEQYCKDLNIGKTQRPTPSSVYLSADDIDNKRPHILVLGRHDIGDLQEQVLPEGTDDLIAGPGVSSRLAATIAFTEGFLAAQTVTEEAPVNVSVLSLGETDTFAAVAPTLFLGHIDAVVVTSAVDWDPEHPTITTGCRGRVVAELSLTSDAAVDDFMTSGALRNPLSTMMQMLGELRDAKGRIALDGFYDRAQAPDSDLRDAWDRDGHDPNAWASTLDAQAPTGRLSSLERASLWPGVSVLSVEAPDADGAATPHHVKARVAFYLVPDQRHVETAAALRDWFTERAPSSLSPHISVVAESRPYRAAADSPVLQAQSRAAYRLFGRKPILVPAGGPPGSGEVAFAARVPVAFAGIADPTHEFGTTGETLSWGRFEMAVAFAAETLLQLRRS